MSRVASMVLATLAGILFLRFAQEVVIPLLLAWFLFFALNPVVGWLTAWKVPRLVASAAVLAVVLGGLGYGLFSLRDEALEVIEELLGRAARMNQVAIFCGLLFWSWMWGLWGMLLAVPMMMVMKAFCDRVEGLRPLGELVSE